MTDRTRRPANPPIEHPPAASSRVSARAPNPGPETPCRHCGLPLGRAWRSEFGPFCCNGCKAVYELIHAEGLGDFYRIRSGPLAPPQEPREGSFVWLDRLLGDSPSPAPGRPRRITLDVQGIHCAACIWLLEELLARHPGGLDIRVNPSLGKADITWQPDQLDIEDYLREVERFGYRFGPSLKEDRRASRGLVVRLGVCTAATMNVMIFTLCFYFGLAPTDGALYTLFGRLNLALGLLVVLVGGSVFFRSAALALRRGLVHLDLPIASGILLGYTGSLAAYLSGGPEAAYFDTITIFVTLMLVGRWLQERVLEKNRQALLADDRIENLTVRRLREGRLELVAAAEIAAGDQIMVLPADLVPVESILRSRTGAVALDWITGESDIRGLTRGDTVPAGALNAARTTSRLEAGEPFSASRLPGLLGSSRAETAGDTGPDRWWQRVAALYVGAVGVLAVSAFSIWWAAGLTRAIQVTVAVLVVTCPCALGLATPLAQELVHVALRRRGIFLRDAGFLRRALRVRKVLFDKTGTLTPGHLVPNAATHEALAGLDEVDRTVLFNMAARSHHPASRSLHAALGGAESSLPILADLEVSEQPGEGLEAVWQAGRYRLGRPAFVENVSTAGVVLGISTENDLPGPADGKAGTFPTAGRETLFALDGSTLARLTFTEALRADAVEEVARLRDAGYEVRLLSGDHPDRVQAVADRLGIPGEDAFSGLDPEAKRALVEKIDAHDTLMVGDGINDAPAFEAAWCRATPTVDRATIPSRADFYFLGAGIAAVRTSLAAARRCQRVVRNNLAFAVAYNILAVGLCLAGLVGPVLAAILMPLSSVTLVSHTAWRLSRRQAKWTS